MKKDRFISNKIKKLKSEGYKQDQAVAIALSMSKDRYQTGGEIPLTSAQLMNMNKTKPFAGLEVTPEFGTSGYFVTEEQLKAQEAARQAQEQAIKNRQLSNIIDITSDGQFTNRKVWHTQHPEWWVGKQQQPVEGVDYTTVPYRQWQAYQSSPAYLNYMNKGRDGLAEMQTGGSFFFGNQPPISQNTSFSTQPITLQSQSTGFNMPNYGVNLTQLPNEIAPLTVPNPYNIPQQTDTGAEYMQGDNNLDGVVDEKDLIDKFGKSVYAKQNINENFQYFNPYGGFSIPEAAYKLGQGIETGNTFDIATSGLKLATGLGRNIVSGMGTANRKEYILEDYLKRARETSVPATQYMQNGGNINIDPENKGKFTEAAHRAGYPDAQSFAQHVLANPDKYDTITVQRANFARNATHFKHQDGGEQGQPSPEQIIQAFAQISGQDPQQIIAQLQQMPPQQQQQALQQMVQALQQGQEEQGEGQSNSLQEEQGEQPTMQNGGTLKKKEQNQLATGEYVAEVPSGEEEVAEVEKNEFIKTPDGETKQVLGDSHEEGGVELTAKQLPNGSKIISDHLKVGKEGAKKFNDAYDLGIKSTDTYATILDKYNKKAGLDKIVEEQEMLSSKLQKQSEKLLKNPTLESTIQLNIDFLTKEFEELEQQKAPIIEARGSFFDEVFNLQEESKTGHNAVENNKSGEKESEDFMQQGGTFNGDLVVAYSKKYNLPEEKVSELLYEFKNGGLKQYQNGTDKYGVTNNENVYSTNIREQQHAGKEAYGNIEKLKAIQELYNNFPTIINSDAGFKKYIDVNNKGQVKFKEDIPLNVQSTAVNNIQRSIDETMRDSAQLIINNPDKFSSDAVNEANRYYKEETFLPDVSKETNQANKVRGYDAKLGQFTSGRYSMKINLVNPDELKMLADNGITTVKQLRDSPIRAKLSPATISNLENVEQMMGNTAADYSIAEITPNQRPLEITSEKQTPSFTGNNTQEVNTYGLLNLPDQSPLLPDRLQGTLKMQRRYDRVQAPVFSPDAQINEIRRQESAAMESLNSLPDAQRAAAIAQIQANTQSQLNNVIGQTTAQNQAAAFQADSANAQIQAREEDARVNDLQNYENKILKAEAITSQDLKNYYNTLQRINIGNYNTIENVNRLNELYPNTKFTPQGVQTTNMDYATNYSNAPMDRYQALQDAQKTVNKFKVETKSKPKKRFGGVK